MINSTCLTVCARSFVAVARVARSTDEPIKEGSISSALGYIARLGHIWELRTP